LTGDLNFDGFRLNTIASQAQVRHISFAFASHSRSALCDIVFIEDLEGLTQVSTPRSMTVLARKACDEVATAILSDLAFLK
jgi:hypothetical protein